MRFRNLRWRLPLLLLASVPTPGIAQSVNLPKTVCQLEMGSHLQLLEAMSIERALFSGCIEFFGNFPLEFDVAPKPAKSAALQLAYAHDEETRLLFWVYRNSGPTKFNEDIWNAVIGECMATLPDGQTGTIETPFKEGKHAASPILGHVPMKATVSIVNHKKEKAKFWFMMSLVPVADTNRVLLIVLKTTDENYRSMKSVYRSFTKSLYLQ